MKKMMCLLCILVILIAMCGSARATDSFSLSELTDEEYVSFLEDYGVDIPGPESENMSWIPFIRAVIKMIEENPQTEFSFGYTVALEFAYDIKTAVNTYYTAPGVRIVSNVNTDTPLKDNIVYGTWMQEYKDYNCYAYAIGYSQGINPGHFSNTGDVDGDGEPDYTLSGSVSEAAGCVRADLESIGYTVTQYTETQPGTTVSDHTKLICIRVDVDGTYYYGHCDYHLMKKEEDGNWYHKPGKTNPLRYLHTPSNGSCWVSEGYDGENQRYFCNPYVTYDSEIRYIEYITPHEWEYMYSGSGQHTKSCTICENEELLSCEYEYTSNGDGTHTGTCVCGNVKTASCRPEYTNITNTRHSVSCTECDYYIASQACQLSYRAKDGKTHTVSCAKCENRRTQNCGAVITYTGSGQHSITCHLCEYDKTENCSLVHTYCGDGSQNHTHNTACSVCENQSQTGTACTFVYRSHGDNTHSYLCSLCGYVKIDHALCLFNANNICRTCGAPKNGAVINKLEEVTPE